MKLLLKLIFAVVLLFVLLVVGIGFLIDPAAVKAVSTGVTSATGCNTSLGSANIGLLSGEVSFSELEIANPPGFREGPMLMLGDFNANWDTASLFSDEVQVSRLELDGLVLALELQGTKTNLGPLIDSLRELSEASKGADDPQQPSEPGSGDGKGGEKKVHIDEIRVRGVRAELFVSGVPGLEGDYAVDVPEFVIEDLGNGKNSATVSEWSGRILTVLLDETKKAGDGKFPAQWQSLLSGDLGELKDKAVEELKDRAIEELKNEASEWIEENQDELPTDLKKGLDALKKEGGSLGDLFGGGGKSK